MPYIADTFNDDKKPKDETKNRIKVFYGSDPVSLENGGNAFAWPEATLRRKEFYNIKATDPDVAETVYQCNPTDEFDKKWVEKLYRSNLEWLNTETKPTLESRVAELERQVLNLHAALARGE